METYTLTIPYPSEILWALRQEPSEFEQQARWLLALALYESGKLSTGLAARLAGMGRVEFILALGRYGLSPYGETAEEVEGDLTNARRASGR